MRILLLGRNGQLGWELQRSLSPLGDLVALGREPERGMVGDLADLDGLAATVRAISPHIVVNAAAYTAVDQAEEDPESAERINAVGPGRLAEEAERRGAWIVHYSTDYVFGDQQTRPRREDDVTDPLNVYGMSKLRGEEAVRQSANRHLILRTSWIYSSRGSNFMRTILRLGRKRRTLPVVQDQLGAPTGAELIADVTSHLLRMISNGGGSSGTFHVAAGGYTSWYDYARFILDVAARHGLPLTLSPEHLQPVDSRSFPRAARRPRDSRLDTSKLQHATGLRLPEWQRGVERTLTEIIDTSERPQKT